MPRRTPPPDQPLYRVGDKVEKVREASDSGVRSGSDMPMNTVFVVSRINRPFGQWAYWSSTTDDPYALGRGAWEEELLPRKLIEEDEDA